uniref:PAN2 UCH domain-containing protein n=2 Tax=Timema TaxID=61471 RepID=A0A7R8VVV8_TIMDO|nr:unnamed protein product [Timema douglasi]
MQGGRQVSGPQNTNIKPRYCGIAPELCHFLVVRVTLKEDGSRGGVKDKVDPGGRSEGGGRDRSLGSLTRVCEGGSVILGVLGRSGLQLGRYSGMIFLSLLRTLGVDYRVLGGDTVISKQCLLQYHLETNSSAPNTSHLYYTHSWLPLHLKVDLMKDGHVNVKKLQPTEVDKVDPKDDEAVLQSVLYNLSAVVCYVNDPQHHERRNLVALINVTPEYHERFVGSPVNQWYIFNDFSISPVSAQEVVWFSLDWKVPCVLYWTNHHFPATAVPPLHNPLTMAVFGEDECLARNSGRRLITFTPLALDEMPGKGDIVAMDAEFVTLNQEEAELRSDGKMSTIKPSHMSVARITCIRG